MRSSVWSLLLALLVCCAIPAAATPMSCPTSGTYADLVSTNAAGGCFVADKLFSDFVYLPSAVGGAVEVPSTSFTYITIANPPVAVGFQFAFALSALPGQSNDVQISWLVTGPNITSNHLAVVGGTIGNAVASVSETYCKGGPIAGCDPANAGALLAYYSVFGNQPVDDARFAPVQQLGIFKDINVTAGSGGFATISGLTQTVDQTPFNDDVPEPATMALSGAALAAVGALSRLRMKL